MATAVSTSTSIPAATGVGKRRAIAVGGAALAPTAGWLLAQATGVELEVTVAGQPPMVIGLPLVVATALAASLAGWAALAILQRMTGHARGLWTSLAIAALLASLGPVAIVETTTETRILLALMHAIVAIVLILGLRATIPAHRPAEGRQGQS
jgi:peptidoglycan/LPS O-acetylase OafA/YrhL